MADKFNGSVNLKLKSKGKLDKKSPDIKRTPEFQFDNSGEKLQSNFYAIVCFGYLA
jgi:hypothetical protein